MGFAATAQSLRLKRADSLTVAVINPTYPLLKVLLPGEPESDRGIEIELPEHVVADFLQKSLRMDKTEDRCKGCRRKIVFNGNSQPCLIVNDLKLGSAPVL